MKNNAQGFEGVRQQGVRCIHTHSRARPYSSLKASVRLQVTALALLIESGELKVVGAERTIVCGSGHQQAA